MTVAIRRRACPLCGDANAATPPHPYSRPPWEMIACAACGFVHMRDVPETEALIEDLAWEKTFPEEAKRRKREQPLVAWLDAKTRWRLSLGPRTEPSAIVNRDAPDGPVIDLGCGSGGHLEQLAARFTPFGVEISKALADRAEITVAARGGHIVQDSAHHGLEQFPDSYFAGALLRSYLEHDADAATVLAVLARKMRPDGIAVVKVPNWGSLNRMVMRAGWCGIRLPDHVNYFTPASLREMAGKAGFSTHYPLLLSLPTDDNMIAVLRRA
jgi:SAM-dependent methyltransferase